MLRTLHRFPNIPTFLLLIACFVICIAGCGNGDERADHATVPKDTARAKADVDWSEEHDIVEEAISFYGWISDSAVMVEEALTAQGEQLSAFYLLKPGSDELDVIDPELPDSLEARIAQGVEISADGKSSLVLLNLSADSISLNNLEAMLPELTLDDTLPDPVPAALSIMWTGSGSDTMTLWQDSIYVGPYYGEAAIEYRLPSIIYAERSPSGGAVMVALQLNDFIEYFVFNVDR